MQVAHLECNSDQALLYDSSLYPLFLRFFALMSYEGLIILPVTAVLSMIASHRASLRVTKANLLGGTVATPPIVQEAFPTLYYQTRWHDQYLDI